MNTYTSTTTIDACTACDLAGRPSVPSYQHGEWTGLVVVGEAPGAEEERRGQPFVGESGELLWRMLKDAGVENVLLTNVLKHRPTRNAKPTPAQSKACIAAFLRQETANAKVVVCAGDVAMKAMGLKGGILKGRGRWHQKGNVKLVAMPHPAYMLRRRESDDFRALYDEWVSVLKQAQARLSPMTLPAVGPWDGDSEEMAVDVETDGLDPRTAKIEIIGGASSPGDKYGLLSSTPCNELTMHNATFDAVVLAKAGHVDLTKVQINDTMVMAHLVGEQDLSLKGLASRLLNLNLLSYEEAVASGQLESYCAYGDARSTALLKNLLLGRIEELSLPSLWYDVERPLTPILAHMTAYGGFDIDRPGLQAFSDVLRSEMSFSQSIANDIVGRPINISSGDQVAAYLYNEVGLPTPRTTGSGKRGSVDNATLQQLRGLHPLPSVILNYRRVHKLLTTYVEPILVNEAQKVSAIWHQCGTTTGRLSSSSRNMQNIPKEITHFFVAPEGHTIVHLDLSQIELRTAAYFSGDPVLTKAFQDNVDVHSAMAQAMFNVQDPTPAQRQLGKVGNFIVGYGGDAAKIVETASRHGVSLSFADAAALVSAMKERYKVHFRWMEEQGMYVLARFESRGLWNRRFVYPRPETPEQVSHIKRCAIDYPNQGAGADITKRLMVVFTRMFGWCIVNQVYDSIDKIVPIKDAPMVAKVAQETVEQLNWLGPIPLRAEVRSSRRLDGTD